MADAKITALTADTAPTTDDLIVTVTDPGGTPANRKVTLADLTKAQIPQAAIASIPSAGWTGRTFFPTDAALLGRDDGSAWDYYAPIWPIVDPTAKTWTTVNTATITNLGPYKNAYNASNGSAWNLRGQYYTAPSAPYTVELGFFVNIDAGSGGQCHGGVGWRENTSGKYVLVLPHYDNATGTPYFAITKFTDKDNFSAHYIAQTRSASGYKGPFWIRMENDNTNLKVHVSADNLNYIQTHSVAKADFFTTAPDGIFYGVVPFSAAGSCTLFHLKES